MKKAESNASNFRSGYAFHNMMKKSDGSLCTLGPNDAVPSDPLTQSFAMLNIGDLDTKELTWVKFNTDNYNDQRIKAGYLCEKEGKINSKLFMSMGLIFFLLGSKIGPDSSSKRLSWLGLFPFL